MRLLIGDNVEPFTYTDSELRSAVTLGPAPALPADVVLMGVSTFVHLPVGTGSSFAASMDEIGNMDNVVDMDTLEES